MSTSCAAASAGPSIKTRNTSGVTSTSHVRDASFDWVLKSTGLKGSHQVSGPMGSTGPQTISLTTGLDEFGKARV